MLPPVLRTPDERFVNLADFPFAPHYIDTLPDDAEAQAYAAPFPDIRYKAGVRRFPNLVPDHLGADGAELSRQARDWWQSEWNGRTFMAIGMRDPVLGPSVMHNLRKLIKGCPQPMEVAEGGHFVQEHGDQIAHRALQEFFVFSGTRQGLD